jgi:hypothetical protein
MTGVLGCPEGYAVEVMGRGGRDTVARLAPSEVVSVRWDRHLSATSGAVVEVRPRSAECAGAVAGLIPWAHEMRIWRDADPVWAGPVTDVADNGEAVTVTCRDLTGWLPRRIVHEGYDFAKMPMDISTVADVMISDAYAPADPDAIRWIRRFDTGITVARAVAPESVMADADLSDLVRLGLEWTVVGRRIMLFGGSAMPPHGARLNRLAANDFTGPQGVVRTGEPTVTRAVVQGGGVRGVAGGVDPVLGLHERLDTQTAVTTGWDAEVAANAALYPAAGVLLAGGDLGLVPFAPVTVPELVPGVSCPVSAAGAALVADTVATLTKVSATWGADGGEKVTVTLTAAQGVRA